MIISGPRIPEPQPECTQDAECPSQLACISSHCQNPCTVANVCSPDQECRVLDTLPLRTVMCQCPPDTIADSSGRCKPIGEYQSNCISQFGNISFLSVYYLNSLDIRNYREPKELRKLVFW